MNREKFQPVDRIKCMLNEWASYHIDGVKGYPSQSAFAIERVQTSGVSVDIGREVPEHVKRLNDEIERLAPRFKQVIVQEYRRKGPQKLKAAKLNIPRQVFSQRLSWIHEQLAFVMLGEDIHAPLNSCHDN